MCMHRSNSHTNGEKTKKNTNKNKTKKGVIISGERGRDRTNGGGTFSALRAAAISAAFGDLSSWGRDARPRDCETEGTPGVPLAYAVDA